MSEELHEIQWTRTSTSSARLTQAQIEMDANSPADLLPAYREACREWLANNPEGMTREQFNQLPDGSVVQLKSGEQFRVQDGRLWSVVWTPMIDNNLDGMSVVSTPEPPTLDDVARVVDAKTTVWERFGDDMWERANATDAAVIRTPDLLKRFGPLTPLLPGPQIGGEA